MLRDDNEELLVEEDRTLEELVSDVAEDLVEVVLDVWLGEDELGIEDDS